MSWRELHLLILRDSVTQHGRDQAVKSCKEEQLATVLSVLSLHDSRYNIPHSKLQMWQHWQKMTFNLGFAGGLWYFGSEHVSEKSKYMCSTYYLLARKGEARKRSSSDITHNFVFYINFIYLYYTFVILIEKMNKHSCRSY